MSTAASTPHATPLGYSLLVMAAPYSHEGALTAYRFAESLHAKGHRLLSVFFYHDGVYNASAMQHPQQDEPSLVQLWQSLASDTECTLYNCIAASIKRGIMDESEAKRHGEDLHTLADGFELAGLGQLIHASAQSDRFITFA